MAKVGALGVAVFDCLVSCVSPSVLVGRVELGAPSLHRVKKVRREVGEVVRLVNDAIHDWSHLSNGKSVLVISESIIRMHQLFSSSSSMHSKYPST
jgi:hypothetical protein